MQLDKGAGKLSVNNYLWLFQDNVYIYESLTPNKVG